MRSLVIIKSEINGLLVHNHSKMTPNATFRY